MTNDYDDIINLPHYEPKRHPRMSMMARAAQFAPFAAVSGHDAAIREEGRVTDEWRDVGDTGNEELNRKMEQVLSRISDCPSITIEYFLPDSHKSGGSYQSFTGKIKEIDELDQSVVMIDGFRIKLGMITDIRIQEYESNE